MLAVVIDQLAREVRNEAPWSMMCAGDNCAGERKQKRNRTGFGEVEDSLERRGMKVSRTVTEYLCANEQEVRFPTVTM